MSDSRLISIGQRVVDLVKAAYPDASTRFAELADGDLVVSWAREGARSEFFIGHDGVHLVTIRGESAVRGAGEDVGYHEFGDDAESAFDAARRFMDGESEGGPDGQ